MLKLVIISVLLGLYSADKIKCLTTGTGTDKKVEAKECDDGVTKCSGPILNILTGITAQAYGCGPCPADSAATCSECAGTECHKLLVAGDDFMCDTFTFDATSKAFKAADTQQKCKAVESVKNKCNKPGTKAKVAADYTAANKGCGVCVKAVLDAEKCAETDGAAALTAFLLPLLAALYTLF